MVDGYLIGEQRRHVDDELRPLGAIKSRVCVIQYLNEAIALFHAFRGKIGQKDRPGIGLINLIHFVHVKRLDGMIDSDMITRFVVLDASCQGPVLKGCVDNVVDVVQNTTFHGV